MCARCAARVVPMTLGLMLDASELTEGKVHGLQSLARFVVSVKHN